MRSGGRIGRWVWAAAGATVVAIVAVGGHALSTAAGADDVDAPAASTTQPAPPPTSSPPAVPDEFLRRQGRMGGGFGGGPRLFAGRGNQPPTDAERDEAMAFMALHAPQYSKTVADLPDDDYRTRVEDMVASAYATYQQLKPNYPALYDVILKRIEVEDRIFGLRMKVRTAADDTARAALEKEVHDEVTTWCDLSLRERHLRLERLEKTVQQEKSRLADDDAKRDDLISSRVYSIMHGHGGGGGGGGGWFPGAAVGRGDGGRGGSADGNDSADGNHPPH
jgi:hypothetical protein